MNTTCSRCFLSRRQRCMPCTQHSTPKATSRRQTRHGKRYNFFYSKAPAKKEGTTRHGLTSEHNCVFCSGRALLNIGAAARAPSAHYARQPGNGVSAVVARAATSAAAAWGSPHEEQSCGQKSAVGSFGPLASVGVCLGRRVRRGELRQLARFHGRCVRP